MQLIDRTVTRPKWIQIIENTILNREWFCIGVILFTYVNNLIPISAREPHVARYIILWAVPVLLYDFFTKRNTFRFYGNWYLILFTLFMGVTILLSGFTNYVEQLTDAAIVVVVFFMFYTIKMEYDTKRLRGYLRNISVLCSVLFLINTVISFVTLILRISIYYERELNGAIKLYYLGIDAVNGRFAGLQGNPNLLSWFALAGICFSILWYALAKKRTKWLKVYTVASVVLQCICIALSESRGAAVGLCVGLCVALWIYAGINEKWAKGKKKIIKAAFFSGIAVVSVCIFFVSSIAGSSMIKLYNQVNAGKPQTGTTAPGKPGNTGSLEQREYEGDLTTGRFVLMKTGIQVAVQENILFGVGKTNADEQWLKYKPENYSGELSDAGNMHNLFVQLFLFNGVAGLAVFLLFMIYFLVCVRRVLMKKEIPHEDRLMMAGLFFGIGSIGFLSMVENILIYSYLATVNYLFFLLLGCTMHYFSVTFGKETVKEPLGELMEKFFSKKNKQEREETRIQG